MLRAPLRARLPPSTTASLVALLRPTPTAPPPPLPCRALASRLLSAGAAGGGGTPSLAPLIKKLRSATGAPLMECKRALSDPEVGVDLEKAVDWLRRHGSARAAARVDGRESSEGLVGLALSADGTRAATVRVSSETDFAGRSGAFARLVEAAAGAALDLASSTFGGGGRDGGGGGSIDVEGALLAATVPPPGGAATAAGGTVKDALDGAVLAIRENIQIAEASALLAGPDSVLAGYVHGRVQGSDTAGSAAAVVEVGRTAGSGATEGDMRDAGRRLAMHVVAARPEYLSPGSVPREAEERERAALMGQVADSGKPPRILEKMVEGRMRKFYEATCLTEQAHVVEEGGPKVSDVLGAMGMEVRRFERTSVR